MDNIDEEYWKNLWAGFYKRHTCQLLQEMDNLDKEYWEYWKQQHDNVLSFLIFENIVIGISLFIIILILLFL